MDIRILREEDREDVFRILSQAFMRSSRDRAWFDKPRPPLESYGVWDASGLQATATTLHFDMHVGAGAVVPMGGVAGVASLPASRGKGYARAALLRALERMRENGQCSAVLCPFSFAYYQALGWDWVGRSRRYSVPTRLLRASPEADRVREAGHSDRDAIVSVYTRFAARYRGMIRRHPMHWDAMLADEDGQFVHTYLYDGPDGPEGYLTYREGSEDLTSIREFVCLTPAARRGPLALLRRMGMQVGRFGWSAPEDDLLWHELRDWDVETKAGTVAMGRIVDVEQAIAQCAPPPNASGAVRVEVRDGFAPWNSATWLIDYAGGAAAATKTSGDAAVAIDIRALSQAWMGTPDLDELRAAERVDVRDAHGWGHLKALLDGPPMWLSDDW